MESAETSEPAQFVQGVKATLQLTWKAPGAFRDSCFLPSMGVLSCGHLSGRKYLEGQPQCGQRYFVADVGAGIGFSQGFKLT
jgi:hypothetical protein